MATPQPKRLVVTPTSALPLSITPGSRILKTPLSDETIWKRLKEAGFDEDSIKRSDKAALIAYIAKLEAEVFNLPNIYIFKFYLFLFSFFLNNRIFYYRFVLAFLLF